MFCSAVIGAFLGRTPAAVSSDPSGLPAKGRCLITPTLPSPCCRGTCPLGVKGRGRKSFLPSPQVPPEQGGRSRGGGRGGGAGGGGGGGGGGRRAPSFCRDRMLGGADRLNPAEAAVAPGVLPQG